MGGQQAYHWAVMHGSGSNPFVKTAVVICGSAKTSGLNYAFLEGPTAALLASRDYDQGRYKQNGVKPTEGLRAFGRVYAAWVPSAEWFRQELWRKSGAQSVHEWMNPPIGTSSYEDWDPEDLLTMARMWQAGDVGIVAGRVDYKQALAGITARVLVMPCETDQYFSAEDGKTEVEYLRHGVYRPISSVWGHMAGAGVDPADADWMDERISEFLEG
jgi:homoserine O-acetyltransferase